METISSVLSLITPGCYLVSIDLKDAYYSVPIHTDYTKYFSKKYFSGKESYISFLSFRVVCVVDQENLQS